MRFEILGELRVVDGGQILDLGGHRQRSLVALLLANRGEVVSSDRLLEHLWGDDAADKENALWVYISRLRSALEPNRTQRGANSVLITQSPGYRINLDDAEFDVFDFERLLEEAQATSESDPERKAELLAGALALWRGEALRGFRDERFLGGVATRLDEMHVLATEDRIESDLARGQDRSLIPELEALRRDHPFRERPVELSMRCLYRSGRAPEALRSFARFRQVLGDELGLEPSPELCRLEEQMLLHDDKLRSPVSDLSDRIANPFVGLRPFGEDDAGRFFGRNSLVAELSRAAGAGGRLVALVGASGSGKSSVIRAGLLPAIAKAAETDARSTHVAYMVPGAHPFAEIEAALLRVGLNGPDSLSEQLSDPAEGLLRAILCVLPSPDDRLVLVIDQLEELFTLVDDESTVRRFLSNVVTVLDDPHDRVTVVVTIRADFYGEALEHPGFGARLSGSVINVTPLSPDELADAAVEPAREAGVSVEPALLSALTSDVAAQGSALPLFQYTLRQLFEQRVDRELTLESYRALGGLSGALARQADETFRELSDAEREATRQVFLRLVAGTEVDHRARRRVVASELVGLGIDKVAIQSVMHAFGRQRLLSFDADRLTGSPTVEVAHEALLTAWPQLDAWLSEGRNDVVQHGSLGLALREWQLSGHDRDYLLAGGRLADFVAWRENSTMKLSEDEQRFLDAGIERESAERAAERQRQLDERGARRRIWALVGVLAVALAVAGLVLSGVFASDTREVAWFGFRAGKSWNDNIAAGVDRAAADFGFELLDVQPTVDPAAEIVELAERTPDLIVSDGFPVSVAPDVFERFPDVQFALVDTEVSAPNVATISFKNHEGAFLAGVAAAMKTTTGTVGFVGATPGIIGPFQAGFEAGAAWVDPRVNVVSTYIESPYVAAFLPGVINPFMFPRLGYDRALDLYGLGADVVFHAAGFSGFGTFAAAVDQSSELDRHLWVIGVDNDQWFGVEPAERPHVLTSVIKRGDIAAYELIKRVMEEGEAGGLSSIGMADGAFGYSTQGDGMSDEMIQTLDRVMADIAGGDILVPSQPTGEVLVLDPAHALLEREFVGLDQATIQQILDGFFMDAANVERFDSTCTMDSREADLACAGLLVEYRAVWEATR